MLGGMTLVFTRTACPATRHKYVYHGKNEMQPLFVKKHSYYPALASNPTHGGGGMVDRYMGWYGGYGMAYMRVLRCCIMWCVRQSHYRGPTVRLIVFALGPVHPKPQNACRGICRTDIRVSINDYKKPPQGDGFNCMATELQICQQRINQFLADFFG